MQWILFFISLVIIFLGFIIKQNMWGVGDYMIKEEKDQCSTGYWINAIGVVLLLITLILDMLKRSKNYASGKIQTAQKAVTSAYGTARNSASKKIKTAQNAVTSAYGSARKTTGSMFKSTKTQALPAVEMQPSTGT